jgi:hypothetical protein
MAAAGAFQVVYGLSILFVDKIAPGATPLDLFSQPFVLMVFVIVMAISALSQLQLQSRVRVVGGR